MFQNIEQTKMSFLSFSGLEGAFHTIHGELVGKLRGDPCIVHLGCHATSGVMGVFLDPTHLKHTNSEGFLTCLCLFMVCLWSVYGLFMVLVCPFFWIM